MMWKWMNRNGWTTTERCDKCEAGKTRKGTRQALTTDVGLLFVGERMNGEARLAVFKDKKEWQNGKQIEAYADKI